MTLTQRQATAEHNIIKTKLNTFLCETGIPLSICLTLVKIVKAWSELNCTMYWSKVKLTYRVWISVNKIQKLLFFSTDLE